MHKFTVLNTDVFNYLLAHQSPASKYLAALREQTDQHRLAEMCTAENQVSFMVLIAKLMRAKKIIEVGVFTGVTTLALAEVIKNDSAGKIIACDISDEFTNVGEPYWVEAGVREKIELKIAPAKATLFSLVENPVEKNSFDLIYIDADKAGYIEYFNLAMQLIRPGGLILADNALRSGEVVNAHSEDKTTQYLIRFNQHVKQMQLQDPSLFDFNLLPIGDGLMMILKNK